jgi:hypothetical protein
MRNRKVNGPVLAHTYHLGEFLQTLTEGLTVNPNNKSRLEQYVAREGLYNPGWHGLADAAKPNESACNATMRLIREGWTAGVDLMQQVAASVDVPTPMSVRRRSVWSDQGDEVEMQRVWNGSIESAWRRMRRAESLGPRRVRILVDSIASGALESDVMRWRGVAAMRLADALITAGYSVRVESGFEGYDGDTYRLRVVVKDYTSPLDLSSLAATTALPAFFRALGHAWHFVPSERDVHNEGYSVRSVNPADFVDSEDDAPFFVAGQSISNAARAGEWVSECVAALNPAEALAA